MYSNLYQNINYSAKVDYLISVYIREYDISKANINILLKYKAISLEDYNYYYSLDRDSRQKQIGLLQLSNPIIKDTLKNGIIEAKKYFFEANDIQDYEILAIKNDAIFLINKIAQYTQFDNILFNCKNVYTSFYRLSNKEYYYLYDPINKIENLDIKGIKKDALFYHKQYFLDFILTIFETAQTSQIDDVISILKNFYIQYINKSLDIRYYRRFDAESVFELPNISKYTTFKAASLSQKYLDNVDISYNLNILTQLIKIYSGIYFQK